MQNDLRVKLLQYQKNSRRRKKIAGLVAVLSVAVTIITALCLKLPAVTMQAICGKEEHTHGQECWATVETPASRELICTIDSDNGIVFHSHDSFCYNAAGELICTLAELAPHCHTEACFSVETCLICESEEEDHEHDEFCYEEERMLICTLTESYPHTHTGECEACGLPEAVEHQHCEACIAEIPAETEQVLICALEEHVHSDACYPEEKTVCGLLAHTHAESCYQEDGVLICEAAEHIHTKECRTKANESPSDDSALSEASEERKANGNNDAVPDPYASYVATEYNAHLLNNLVLTGNWAKDVIAVAGTQLGYRESTTDYILDGNGNKKGFTFYGKWYGSAYSDWCAMFVSYCLDAAKVNPFPQHASCSKWVAALQKDKLWFDAVEKETEKRFIPSPGDLIFYDFDLDGSADHVGLVSELTEETETERRLVKTIEGNVSDMVCRITHAFDYKCILGYGKLPKNPDNIICVSAETESGLTVTVSGVADSFPGPETSLKLDVRELNRDTATQEEIAVYDQMDAYLTGNETGKPKKSLRLFDLTIYCDGELSQLTGLVTVTISDVADGSSDVYHVTAETVEDITSEQSSLTDVSFHTTHFSFFGVVSDGGAKGTTAGEAESASLTVHKTWADTQSSHQAVTVTLYKNNVATNRTLTLSAQNGWTAVFDGLEIPGEGDDFAYTVQETPVDGYLTEYGAIKQLQTVTEEIYWVEVASNQMTNGRSYVFCTKYTNGNYYTPGCGSDVSTNTAMPALQVTKNGPITVNGTSYPSYLTGVDDSAVFTATQSGSGFKLYNDYTGKWFTAFGQCSASNPGTSSYILNTFSGGYIGASAGGKYIYQNNATGGTVGGFGSKNSTSGASVFQVYERVYVTATEHSYEMSITNTYIPSDPGGSGGSGGDYSPEIHKTIDSLGDGEINPDTTLSGDDYYRLYLDVTAAASSSTPVDLLLVLDNSGSMFSLDNSLGGENVNCRNDALLQTLWDLIPVFLNANPENRISIVYFSGPSGIYNGYPAFLPANDPTGSAAMDAWIACGWTNNVSVARGSLLLMDRNYTTTGSGTNYMQGMIQSETLLASVQSGHKPYMLFMSDGVPTYYVQSNGQRGGNGFDTFGMSVSHSFYNKAQQNLTNCYTPTLNAINNFLSTHSDITISSIGFSSEVQGSRASLIQAMPNAGGFYQGAVNTAELYAAFVKVFQAASIFGVSITDQLSPYVELYGEQADYKVTMTHLSTGYETVLYQNGAVTSAGSGIIDSVTYTTNNGPDSTGTVRLKFVDSYALDTDYRYTLSFNVKVTQEAYDLYNSLGQQYPHIGDPETDYGTNDTSSEKPGLHSNKIAYVDYTVQGQTYTDFYVHPVVQVKIPTVELTVTKNVIGNDHQALFSFELLLRDGNGDPLTDIPAGSGYTVDQSAGKVTFQLRHGESVTIEGLPEGTTFELTETGHDAYTVLIKEGSQTLVAGDSYTAELLEDRELTVVNNAGAAMPETGGAGTTIYISCGLALMLIALIYGFARQKRSRGKA